MTEAGTVAANAIETFTHPPLGAYRKDVLANWAKDIPSPDMREGMLANPRLRARIASRVSETAELSEIKDLADHPDFPVIASLITTGTGPFARAIGLAWHRTTIMEWVTWNALSTRMPSIPFEEACALICCVSDDVAKASHLPDLPVNDLHEDDLETYGLALLDVWLATLPDALAQRITLFAELAPAKPHLGRAELVRAVASMKMSEDA